MDTKNNSSSNNLGRLGFGFGPGDVKLTVTARKGFKISLDVHRKIRAILCRCGRMRTTAGKGFDLGEMASLKTLGSSRQAVDPFTLQLQSWKPFNPNSNPKPLDSGSHNAKSQSLGQFLTAPEANWRPKSTNNSVNASYWWEKTKKPNLMEIRSAKYLVHTLKNSGDQLVVIDFYSPGCGGCRALHPKICELAESNPDAIFLKINYEELKKMRHALEIHVLPFFRLYRGSKGRLCSFSSTLSTIGKFKDALAKYNNKTEVQSGVGGRAKGLDESELLRLMSIGEISSLEEVENLFMEVIKNHNPPSLTKELLGAMGDHSLLLGDRA